MKRPRGISEEAWTAAKVIDGVVEQYMLENGLKRVENSGGTAMTIAKLVQHAINIAIARDRRIRIN